ncbi:MAG TPA: carboxypeptidase regulatory-like domain-containing protein [Flavobacteriales bacterium]|nr:carboxypeptidase regulatory-like domain-containing protein [Flavobacteriales bacterium]
MVARCILVLALSCCGVTAVRGQGNADPYVREGDRYYTQMAYAQAAKEYQVAAELGAVNEHVTKRLADCYMRLGNTTEAERWYAVVVKFLNREPMDLYNYAEALKSNGRYEEAEEWMDRYLALTQPEGADRRSNITGFARKFSLDATRFSIREVGINTPFSDFGTAWLGASQVTFASARNETVAIERRAAWNDQPFLDVFTADVTSAGDLANPRSLEGAVNTKYHDGPATANAAADVLWFTRNNYFQGRSRKSQQGISRLSIYKARLGSSGWGDVEQFLYNNSEISLMHPALSPDGHDLYFVSDMPGGFGGTDLYVCHDLGGQWSEPENLGAAVNTPFNEVFPFLGADGTLYFASNGHPGLGGLDVFMASRGSGGFAAAMNIGAPVNGPKDDFAFIIDASKKRGYFSSNRPGGQGDDDIYAFEMLAPLEQRFLCSGTVIDDEYETPVVDAEVVLYDLDGHEVASTRTDEHGEYTFTVQKDLGYRLVARMPGRYDGEQHVSTENIEQQQILTRDIHLVPDAGIWLRGALHLKDRLAFVSGATISVVNLSSFFAENQRTGEGGDFSFRLQSNEEFEVLIEKTGYFSQSVPVSTIGMKQGIIDLNDARDLALEEITIGQAIGLKHIRWAEGSAQLDAVARTELDALGERLTVNPGVSIEVGVHSDARGDAAEQLKLTQKRADAVVAYLKGKGIPKERLTARGYGNSRLLNYCAPGVQCSEEEHAVNRRTEYTVTAVQP